MFTKKRFFSLKFVSINLLAVVFIFGGLFLKTAKTEAVNQVRDVTISYSLSEVVSVPNNVGGMTTTVLIGCAPGSKDVYDINTGKQCVKFIKTVLVGCAPISGDLYDINTGKKCENAPVTVLTGCKVLSGDTYDTSTGKLCLNDTKVKKVVSTNSTKVNIIAKGNVITTENITNKPNEKLVAQGIEINPILNEPISQIDNTEDYNDDTSGREKMKGSLLASVGRVSSIFSGPMSFWIILLIIAILLGGGYGVYSFLKKDDEDTEVKPVVITATPKINNNTIQSTIPLSKEIPKNETIIPAQQTNPIDPLIK
jgi:hypothetical protein